MAYDKLLQKLKEGYKQPYNNFDDMMGALNRPAPIQSEDLSQQEVTPPVYNSENESADLDTEIANTEEMLQPESEIQQTSPLDQAMEHKRMALLASGLSRAGAQIGSAIATRGGTMGNVPINENAYKTMEALGDIPLEKLSQEQKLKPGMNDPNSDVSKFARDYVKKIKPDLNIPDNISAQQLDDLGFKLAGVGGAASKTFQQFRYKDPETKEVKTGVFNSTTGSFLTADGQPLPSNVTAGFAQRTIKDEYGRILDFDPSRGLVPYSDFGSPPSITNIKSQPSERDLKLQKIQDIYSKIPPVQRKMVEKAQTDFLKDAEKLRGQINSGSDALAMLKTGTQFGDMPRAVQVKMARLSGEVGALSEPDVKYFGGHQSLASRTERAYNGLVSNKMLESDRQFLTEYITALNKNAQQNIERASEIHAFNLASKTKMDLSTAKEILNPNAMSMSSNEEKVAIEKDGKHYKVQKTLLDKYLKQGFKLFQPGNK